jgi:two-component system, OmpR family, sensor kinase
MTSLIEGLLGSSLLDGKVELYFHPAEFDLVDLLREVCRLHREVSPRAHIFERLGTAPILILGDRKLLFQVFSNLLSNAIKYSPDGGFIKVIAKVRDGAVEVVVQDHGLGIPKADMERLFERYYRGGNVSGIVGTGIGLHFVKMVTELHQGSVAVQSEEGRGARFSVRLPVQGDSGRQGARRSEGTLLTPVPEASE